ncbi:MAG: lipopolysaccharide biosynthesis protein RfbH [Proteobacteria bacterium]|nr:lipopolysaccharide biosynthesis protein RfbH [Pseudomonadota bacterium]
MTVTDREDVLESCRRFMAGKPTADFIPGETYIPPSGKIIDEDDLVNLVDASLDMWLTTGRFASDFEAALAKKMNVKRALLTVSGSAANLLAFSALTSRKLRDRRILPGSEVLTVAAGFPTTIAPIVQNQCVPVFVDIEMGTYNVNVSQLEAAVTQKTRAIILAHALGNPFNLPAVKEIADRHNLFLIEDCCDALGATFDGKSVGSWGDMSTLSFYPAHHITMGEGGAIMTNRKIFARLVESFRDWGRDCWCPPGQENTCNNRFGWKLGDLPVGYDHKYTYSHLGYNLKTTDMNAAVGLSQIAKVDDFIAARRDNFDYFSNAFKSEGLDEHFILPSATPGSDPSWFGYLITIRQDSPLRRRDVVNYLERHRIGTRLFFAGNITRQPAFEGVEHRVASPLVVSDTVMNDTFWIGVWPGIGHAERSYIAEVFTEMVKRLTS